MQGDSPGFAPFSGQGLSGEISAGYRIDDVVAEIARIIDPAAAVATIHWGRNYLYTGVLHTADGDVPVVVKQFRNQGLRKRLDRRWRGSKATRSWRVVKELLRQGIPTPEPIALVESEDPEGPSFFIARELADAAEVRQFFRRLNREPDPEYFPDVDDLDFLEHLGQHARNLHDCGVVYRDLSMGNVLATGEGPQPKLWVVDFNRARIDQQPSTYRRIRDICRQPVIDARHRSAFLRGYWGEVPPRWSPRWWFYGLSVSAYINKHVIKKWLKGLSPRRRHVHRGGHHDHLPSADRSAGRRDLIVWDHLSDQPHQHAGRWAKTWIRMVDGPDHLRELALVVGAAPKIWSRYRQLDRERFSTPVAMTGFGLCVRPWPDDPEAHLQAIDELGVRKLLIRLHPWDSDHDDEEILAKELHARGCDLVFALPQVRDLVTDLDRWQDAVARLGRRFAPYGTTFQIGQAINRSKWGIWTRSEYIRLFRAAAEALQPIDGVQLAGPATIDFELQVSAALANSRAGDLHFDILSCLLYVDRRGAPENRQMGFDTVDKVLLHAAIAETGRNTTGRSWITEVNWPLREGPHSPAGRTVSVNEESYADYLVRYYIQTLATGKVERVYWWRLVARGYGLISPEPDGSLRRRPGFRALRTLLAQLDGAVFTELLPSPCNTWLYRFHRDGEVVVVAWSLVDGATVELPARPQSAVDRDGAQLPVPDGPLVEAGTSPVYYALTS